MADIVGATLMAGLALAAGYGTYLQEVKPRWKR